MSYATRSTCILGMAASLLLSSTCILAATPAGKARPNASSAAKTQAAKASAAKPAADSLPPLEQLPAACRAAKSAFHPLTKTHLQAAKKDLTDAISRLELKAKAEGEQGAARKKVLQWDKIQKELDRPQPDLAVLIELQKNYLSGQEGLSLAWYIDVRLGLERYLKTAHGVLLPGLTKAGYEALLDDLAARLEKSAAQFSAEDALAIGGALGALEDVRQAPGLVRAVRHHLSHPNLLLRVSEEVVVAGMSEPVDDVRPIRDCILRTDICGTGHTQGQTTAKLVPNSKRATVDTLLKATAKSTAVGENGPVCIYSRATSRIEASKRVWVDAKGLSTQPAVSHAVTHTVIDDICAKRGSKLIERFAWKQAAKQKGLAECIASQHTEQKVNRQVDTEAAATLAKANDSFQKKFRKPLREFKLFPQQLAFSTTKDALRVASLTADATQLAAVTPPPTLVEPAPALTLHLHQSTLNNMAATALAGMVLREERLQDIMLEVLDEVPDQFLADDEQAPWAIRFAKKLPMEVAFADDGFRVVLRGESFVRGRTPHPGMNITARYKFVKGAKGYTAVREPLEVFPPNFDPKGKEGLSAGEVAVQTLLVNRFNRIFKRELPLDGFLMPGKWQKLGTLRPVEVISRDGWLAVAWQRASDGKENAVADAGHPR
jgi:hypothetical protein